MRESPDYHHNRPTLEPGVRGALTGDHWSEYPQYGLKRHMRSDHSEHIQRRSYNTEEMPQQQAEQITHHLILIVR